MGEVLELFEVEGTNHRPLELREKSMFGAGRIEAMDILLTVQDIDVPPPESGPEQCVDGFARLTGVADGPDHAIGRIPDEVPSVSAECRHAMTPFDGSRN
jgi:hypothetical protein